MGNTLMDGGYTVKKLIIISLFDGISCGQQAIQNAGLSIDKYIAYEINQDAINVTQKNFPGTIQMGSVILDRKMDYTKNKWLFKYPDFSYGIGPKKDNIIVLIGGSPCQNLSKTRIDNPDIYKGINGDKSSLVRAFIKAKNTIHPDFFLFENVKMNKADEGFITKRLGVNPVLIDSSEFSAQSRERLYWTDIPYDTKNWDYSNRDKSINDILCNEYNPQKWIDKEYTYNGKNNKVIATLSINYIDMCKRVYNKRYKMCTLTRVTGGYAKKKVYISKGKIRELNAIEYERLQGLPDNYTNVKGLSDSKRCSLIADGWTVTVIEQFMNDLKHTLEKNYRDIP